MKKTEGFEIRKLGEEYVILPVGERTETVNEIFTLSETAGFIYLHAEEVQNRWLHWLQQNMRQNRPWSKRM